MRASAEAERLSVAACVGEAGRQPHKMRVRRMEGGFNRRDAGENATGGKRKGETK